METFSLERLIDLGPHEFRRSIQRLLLKLGFDTFSVNPHLAAAQAPVDMASGNSFKAFNQEIIYTLIITILGNNFFDYIAQRKFFA